jgi:colanic acid biosynthesis glycosyl transferase WcaI
MRILLWSPNHAPETLGIAAVATEAAEWLAGRGHEVRVVTAVPNYPERVIRPEYRGSLWSSEREGGVTVDRSWLRVRPRERFVDKVLYEASFASLSLPLVIRRLRGLDALVVIIPSLGAAVYAAALARLLRSRRPRLILWVQDIVPSAAFALDDVTGAAGGAISVARSAEAFALRRADRVVVCSPGFVGYVEAAGVEPVRIAVALNGVDTSVVVPEPARTNGGATRFLYSGNVGYTQGLEVLVEAAERLGDRVAVDIVGGGNAVDRVRAAAAHVSNVAVRPPVPRVEFARNLAGADVLAVVQRRVAAGANLPSKIAPYLASGRPLVASLDPRTPAASLLRESGAALLVEPENALALAEGMRELHERPELRARLGRAARDYAVANLRRDVTLGRLEDAIAGAGTRRR